MRKRKQVLQAYNIVVIALLVIGVVYICVRFLHPGFNEWTDNAMVHRDLTPVNARVQGFVKEIRFQEFQYVHKGDTLVVLEDTELALQEQQAEASEQGAQSGEQAVSAGMTTTDRNVATANAGAAVAGSGEQIASAQTSAAGAAVQSSQASTDEMRVEMENAHKDFNRYEQLLAKGAVTQQQYDNARTAYESARSRYQNAVARRNQAVAQHDVARANQKAASARLAQANAQTLSTASIKTQQEHALTQSRAGVKAAHSGSELARLRRSYTVITAPCDGYVGRKNIYVGQLIQPGQFIINIVNTDHVWIIANYRETQLKNITVGAKATFQADAIPGVTFNGRVESISLATGAAYGNMPVDNSTGNFVKVEQRVPVRIELTKDNNPKEVAKLISGLNVETKVDY